MPRRLSPRADLARSDHRLLQVIGEAMSDAAARAGSHLACRPGCTECCHGPFPINELDARRLRQGLDELSAREPERARAVAERARAQRPILRTGFPGDPETGVLTGEETDELEDETEEYFARHGTLPCPALDPETGWCDLYAHRPLTCRTFGPPVRIGASDLPPCHLCFQDATAEAIESCRVEPDPHGVEDRILARLGAETETLIVFALVR